MAPQAGQEVQVELYDKDMDKDDFLGRCVVTGPTIHRLISNLLLIVKEYVPKGTLLPV